MDILNARRKKLQKSIKAEDEKTGLLLALVEKVMEDSEETGGKSFKEAVADINYRLDVIKWALGYVERNATAEEAQNGLHPLLSSSRMQEVASIFTWTELRNHLGS